MQTPRVGGDAAPLSADSVGHRLLRRMGWKQGEGLGRAGQGRKLPVEVANKHDARGLGYVGATARRKRKRQRSGGSHPHPPRRPNAHAGIGAGVPLPTASAADPAALSDAPAVLCRGAAVRLRGMCGPQKSRDGQEGVVFHLLDDQYVVHVGGAGGQAITVSPQQLVQLVDGVRLTGIRSRPALNARQGRLLDFDEGRGRYSVAVRPVGSAAAEWEVISLRPECVVPPTGTCMRLVGLTSDVGRRLNDCWGRLLHCDGESGRYVVRVDVAGGRCRLMKVKPANLRM